MANFAVSTSDPYSEVVSSLNYVLANLGTGGTTDANVLVANVATGEITSNGSVVSYLYQYMDVQYANSSTGGSGFSSNSFNKSYYGLRNTANANPISFNPVDYVWYQVTGGFGTTKGLYYQTIGGRQVAFFAGNSAPATSFIPVPDMPTANSTPLDLDTITSAQNNQIVNVNAYYQSNIAPATPSGGTYNFTTYTLTPPGGGWLADIPSFVSNTNVYVSQAAFVGNTNATAAPPATNWTVPAVYTSQFQGNTGPAGERGFVPMGFVLTNSDPTTYSNTQFTTAFSSSRTNPSPPIGLGFAPVQYDTAQFAYQDLFTGNTITTVQQYDGSGWTSVDAQVVSGDLIVPGSINANTLNVNQVYALTIASTNANVGNVASNGFWMQSSNGDARLAGNTSIGNSLTVGNNAVIGSNLTVGNTASIGNNLTVGNNAIVGGFASIGSNVSIGNGLNVGASAQIGNNLFVGSDARISNNLTIGNNLKVGTNAQIGGNLNVTGLITTSTLQANTVVTTTIVNSSVTNQGSAYSSTTNQVNYTGNTQTTSEIDTSTRSTISTTNIPASGALMNVTGRTMALLYVQATTTSVIHANLALVATGGTSTEILSWANSAATVGAGSVITLPTIGGVEVYQANYPYTLSGNGTVTIYGLLKGRVVSGNAKILATIFDNYSPSTTGSELRFTTGQVFKR